MDADRTSDSISRISLKADTLFGKPCGFPKLDKMCGMVIRIRNSNNAAESKNKLIAMLEDVLSSEDSDVKKHKLEDKYDMKMTTELEGRINGMCNLSDVVEERGIERGITGLVEVLREMGTPSEVIIEKIMKKFSLTEEKAREFVKNGTEGSDPSVPQLQSNPGSGIHKSGIINLCMGTCIIKCGQ